MIMTHQQKLYEIKMGWREKECKPKERKPLKKVSDKRKTELAAAKEVGGERELDKYFDYHMKHSEPVCMNCGLRADWLLEQQADAKKAEVYKMIWRSSQAHVLEKKNSIGGFPSVSTNLLNHLVLFPHFAGLCNCHGEFDSSEERMARMKVFPLAVDIVRQLFPFIAIEERKYLAEVFVQEIKPENY
jgi:hypothetical protein